MALGRQLWQKQEIKQVFPVVLKPTQGAGFSCSVPQPTRTAKKNVFFAHLTAATSPRLTWHGSWPNLEGACSTERRALVVKFEGRKWPVSLGFAWDVGGWPRSVPGIIFLRYRAGGPFRSEENDSGNGSGSHVSRKTSRKPTSGLQTWHRGLSDSV